MYSISGKPSTPQVGCSLCDKHFSRPVLLLCHLANVHFGKQLMSTFGVRGQLKCKVCGETRSKRYNLIKHFSDRHNGLKEFLPTDVYEQLISK